MSKLLSADGPIRSGRWWRPQWTWAGPMMGLALAAVAAAVYGARPGVIDTLDLRLMDVMAAARPDPPASHHVAVVTIDEDSLSTYGQWPWPRYRVARLLETLAQAGPRAVAVAVVLAEPDQTSLGAVHDGLRSAYGVDPGVAAPAGTVFDNDAVLADVLSGGPFVLASHVFLAPQRRARPCVEHPLRTIRRSATEGASILRYAEAVSGACALPRLAQAAGASGFVNGAEDADGRLRRLPLVMRRGTGLIPSLALAAVIRALEAEVVRIDETGLQPSLAVRDHVVPLDVSGGVMLRFPAAAASIPQVSASAVLAGSVDPQLFRDRIVFVGVDAAGVSASYRIAGTTAVSAAVAHAHVAENILADEHLYRPAVGPVIEVALALVLGLVVGWAVGRTSLAVLCAASVLAEVIIVGGSAAIVRASGVLLSPFLPGGVVLLAVPVLSLVAYWRRDRVARQATSDALVQLRLREEELASILAIIPDIVFRLDAAGRIGFVSPALSRYRVDPGRLIGRSILDLVSPADRERAAWRVNERRTATRATRDFEVRLALAPGESDGVVAERYFSITAEGLYGTDPSGARVFLGTQGIARDVDQRRRLESQLERARQMEAMGVLAAGVAHDLNNILGALIGYPDLLLMDLPDDSPMRDSLIAIQTSGKRAAAIVQDLLAIARRGVRQEQVLCLNTVVSTYLASPEHRRVLDLHPRVRCESALGTETLDVLGSPVHLVKALMNLVANAAEAMPAGGAIRLTTRRVFVETATGSYERIPPGDYAVLSITDEGVGIADTHLPRIFEPFYSRKAMGHSGTGLGMAVVWNAVKDHRGFVDIVTQEGVGTRFDLYLPVTQQAPEAASAYAVLQDYIGTERILVVDDVPEQLTVAVRLLSKLGYRVSGVPSGEQALLVLGRESIDLLVLDLVMPGGLDGLETLERARAHRPSQRAIVVSGYVDPERLAAAGSLGVGDYVRKPYTLEVIGMAVRRALDRLDP